MAEFLSVANAVVCVTGSSREGHKGTKEIFAAFKESIFMQDKLCETITKETVVNIKDIIKETQYTKIQICKPNKGKFSSLQDSAVYKKRKNQNPKCKHAQKFPLSHAKSYNAFTYPVFSGTYLDKAKN